MRFGGPVRCWPSPWGRAHGARREPRRGAPGTTRGKASADHEPVTFHVLQGLRQDLGRHRLHHPPQLGEPTRPVEETHDDHARPLADAVEWLALAPHLLADAPRTGRYELGMKPRRIGFAPANEA
jgi:hypothetical protein